MLTVKKIETGSRQNDGTMDKEQIQRFPFPWGPPPLKFPPEGSAEADQSWKGEALESHLLLFQSLDPRRLTDSHTLALWLLLERLQELL